MSYRQRWTRSIRPKADLLSTPLCFLSILGYLSSLFQFPRNFGFLRSTSMRSVCALVLGLLVVTSAQAQNLKPPRETALDRFLRYAKIDTQSAEDQTTVPSTRKQLNLATLLAKELKDIGAQNVRVSEFGIVYATVPGNLDDNSKVPVIGFLAHMDTSPAVSGENINPIIHKN